MASDLKIRAATVSDIERIVRLSNDGGPDGKPKATIPPVLPEGYLRAFHRINNDPNQA